MKADIKLGQEEVLEIIRDHITRTTNHKVNDVHLNVEIEVDDYSNIRRPYFKEVVVSVELESRAVYNEAPKRRIV